MTPPVPIALLGSLASVFHTIPGKVLCLGTVIMDCVLAFLAVNGGSNNNALIIVAVFGNITVLIGVCITGWFQVKTARISEARFKIVQPLVELPAKIAELSKGIDGVAHELKQAKEEGAIARVAAAHAEGKLEERADEVGRQGAAALAQGKEQERVEERGRVSAAPPVTPAPPLEVIVKNPKSNPVPTENQDN